MFPAVFPLAEVPSDAGGPPDRQHSSAVVRGERQEPFGIHWLRLRVYWTGEDVSVQPEREGYLEKNNKIKLPN